MTVVAIILLIVVGVFLLILEFLVVPGATIAGIGGIILIGAGIYLTYHTYGSPAGHYALAGSVVFTFLALLTAFKSKTWKKLSLNDNIVGKITLIDDKSVKKGDTGITISRLNPIGKVLVNNESYEAKALSNFIDHNTKIRIIAIQGNTLTVEAIVTTDENDAKLQ